MSQHQSMLHFLLIAVTLLINITQTYLIWFEFPCYIKASFYTHYLILGFTSRLDVFQHKMVFNIFDPPFFLKVVSLQNRMRRLDSWITCPNPQTYDCVSCDWQNSVSWISYSIKVFRLSGLLLFNRCLFASCIVAWLQLPLFKP